MESSGILHKICKLLVLPLLLVLVLTPTHTHQQNTSPRQATMSNIKESAVKSLETFGLKLYRVLESSNEDKNIVFSPFSIQTCAAMARVGAEGETAEELSRGLGLVSDDVNVMAEQFHDVLKTFENSDLLKIANKIYVMKDYTVQDGFNAILTKQFFTSADEIDFSASDAAAHTINQWVESKTNNLIKNLISPSLLDRYTRLVLLNAIHFKGKWQYEFDKKDTRADNFYLDESRSVKVDMMSIKKEFRYGELPDLDATALELPYKGSDLSMMIILPNSRTGLKHLEENLKNVQLSDISSRMYSTKVMVKLPKFKVEFEAELTEPFQKLGMKRMFSDSAQFRKMLKADEDLKVSAIIHKAFIEVNEEGTEAAAATGVSMRTKRSIVDGPRPVEFVVDHPFLYIIKHRCMPSSSPQSTATQLPLFVGSIKSIVRSVRDIEMHEEL